MTTIQPSDWQITPIPAFRDNYLWLIQPHGQSHAYIVDPGDATPVKAYLTNHGLTLAGILVTHHHPDHIGGIDELLEDYPVPVYGPAGGSVAAVTHPLQDGDTLTLDDGLHLEVIAVPGHTLDHLAYFQPAQGQQPPRLYCGDTLFAGGCGRLFEGTPAQMRQSLSRLCDLPDSTEIYCAHEYTLANLAFAQAVEPDNRALAERQQAAKSTRARQEPTLPSQLALEKATNPFLRSHLPEVKSQAEQHQGHSLSDATEVFACLRQWKDNF